jgi:hypothetical protein
VMRTCHPGLNDLGMYKGPQEDRGPSVRRGPFDENTHWIYSRILVPPTRISDKPKRFLKGILFGVFCRTKAARSARGLWIFQEPAKKKFSANHGPF